MQKRQKPQKVETIRIGTRTSQLALWQANFVAEELRNLYKDKCVEVMGMQTLGDKDQMKPLNQLGQTGVFTKELDSALLSGQIDCAVHCLKDLPTNLPAGLHCAAILKRGNVSDALILNAKHAGCTLASLPAGSIVGTSALRRAAVLRRRFPHLQCRSIRGNVNTRLAKLDRGEYDALILAATGLERLGLNGRIAQVLEAAEFGYAVGQGALAVVTRTPTNEASHPANLVAQLTHSATLLATEAERALLRTLAGGCSVPVVVRCSWASAASPSSSSSPLPGRLTLFGQVLSVDGQTSLETTLESAVDTVDKARALGARAAEVWPVLCLL
jgi:hydroxymethylbilane synthase